MNGVGLKAAYRASDRGMWGYLNLRFMFNKDIHDTDNFMCLSYHVEVVLAPETPIFTYRQF